MQSKELERRNYITVLNILTAKLMRSEYSPQTHSQIHECLIIQVRLYSQE